METYNRFANPKDLNLKKFFNKVEIRVINKMEMESQIASLFLNRIKYQREVLAERVMENRVIKVYQFSKITFNIMQ